MGEPTPPVMLVTTRSWQIPFTPIRGDSFALAVVSLTTVWAHLAGDQRTEQPRLRFVCPPPEKIRQGFILIRLLLDLKRAANQPMTNVRHDSQFCRRRTHLSA